MFVTINFKNKVTAAEALGRNGTMECRGLDMCLSNYYKQEPVIQITPVNSKGGLGRCYIEVPMEDIDAVIDALTQMKKATKDLAKTMEKVG